MSDRSSGLEMTVRSVARTHVGRVRRINEDRVLALPDRGLWAIADGMGGHSGGDVAAECVVTALQALPVYPAEDDIRASLSAASRAIYEAAAGSPQGSGSTVVGLSRTPRGALVFWAGDSRCYRLRADTLEQLTHDHSVVQELIDAGLLPPERAHSHPQAHVITRALGTGGGLDLDCAQIDVMPGDLYLLCSDGLTREIEDEALQVVLVQLSVDASDTLLANALAAGGKDNISMVLIAFE